MVVVAVDGICASHMDDVLYFELLPSLYLLILDKNMKINSGFD